MHIMNTLSTCTNSTSRSSDNLSHCKHPLVSLFLKPDLPTPQSVDNIIEQILNNRNQIIERLDSEYYFHCAILTKKIYQLRCALAVGTIVSVALAIKILTSDKI